MNREERNQYNYSLTHKTIDNIEYKQCSLCKEWKEMNLSNFYIWSYSRDGFHPRCQECTRQTNKKRKRDNYNTYYRPKQKEWNDANKDRRKELNKEFELKNPGRKKQIHDDYLLKYPEKTKEYTQKRQKKNHKISNKEWIACKEYFKDEDGDYCCAYCGLKIQDHYKKYRGKLKQIDLHKEHVDDDGANDLSNCIPSCGSCNSKKWGFDFNEWYNENNPVFSQKRLDKINKWLNEDYKLYIQEKKPYIIIKEKDNDLSTFHFNLWEIDEQAKLIKIIATKQKRKDLDEDIKKYLLSIK